MKHAPAALLTPCAAAAAAALLLALGSGATTAWAKLPPPSDEAKAKAAEAAAKTTWSNSVANFQLCKSMDQVASGYFAHAKKAGKDVKPAAATPACADPGPFVYPPPMAASGAAAPAVAAVPAAATAPKKP
jgi:hypothetical protein